MFKLGVTSVKRYSLDDGNYSVDQRFRSITVTLNLCIIQCINMILDITHFKNHLDGSKKCIYVLDPKQPPI